MFCNWLCFPDKHVPALQDPLCFVSTGRGERLHPAAQERPVPAVCHAGVGSRALAV